jgi:hypothetical protein
MLIIGSIIALAILVHGVSTLVYLHSARYVVRERLYSYTRPIESPRR